MADSKKETKNQKEDAPVAGKPKETSKSSSKKTKSKKEGATQSRFRGIFKFTPISTVLSVLFIFFAAQVIALYLYTFYGALRGQSPQEVFDSFQGNLPVQAAVLTLVALSGTLLVRWLLWLSATSWKEIGFTKIKWSHIGSAILGYGWYFLFFFISTIVIQLFVPQVNLDQQQQLGFDRSTTGAGLAIIGFSLIVLPALYEELLMRGVLFTGLRKSLSFRNTAIVVSLIFGAAHLEFGSSALNYAAAIDTFLLSLVLVYLRETNKSIWPAVFLHAIKNAVAFTLVFVFKVTGI